MLAPTRLRLVNVGIERPRFADLIIDMRSNGQPDDTVIMLQNGGGKSTLNAMWLHAYEPERDKFLASLSIRHQGKAGKRKRFEHYIPVGSTTYVVCEHAIAGATEDLFGRAPRLVVGYAAWRDNEAQDRAMELFFCFQSTDALTFDTLPVRGADGQPVPHQDFLDHLLRAKQDDPTLQLAHTNHQGKWSAELASRGFDLEFLRQFLLQMNLDEGAADRIFTYKDSRSFLNSLINVLAEPRDFDTVAREVQRLGGKVSHRDVDLATQEFLATARRFTDPLAAAADRFKTQKDAREAALLKWASASSLVGRWIATADAAATHVSRAHDAATAAKENAQNEQRRLRGQQGALRAHCCKLEGEQAASEASQAVSEVAAARQGFLAAQAAVVIAERATAMSDRGHAQKLLDQKVCDAAPLRQQLAATAGVLADRLDTEIEVLAGKDGEARDQQQADAARVTELEQGTAGCIRQQAEAQQDLDRVAEELAGGRVLRGQLRSDGWLESGESAELALQRHERTATAARGNIVTREQRAATAEAAEVAATGRAEALQPELDTSTQAIAAAETTVSEWQRRTELLGKDVSESGLVEVDTVDLDEQADIIVNAIRSRVEAARADARTKAVRASQLERDVLALESSELLPPRPEVEDLVRQLQQQTNRGVMSGWTWLSSIPADTAVTLLRQCPELADGIVVAIEDDYAPVEAWLVQNSGSIAVSGPIVVAAVTSFMQPGTSRPHHVVLPDPALWSKSEGRDALHRVGAKLEAALAGRDAAETIITSGETLTRELERWITDIGAGSIGRLEDSIGQMASAHRELVEQRQAHLQEAKAARGEAVEHRRVAGEQRTTAAQAEEGVRQVRPLAEFDAADADRQERERDANLRLADARRRHGEHDDERRTIRERADELQEQRRSHALQERRLRDWLADARKFVATDSSEAGTPDPALADLPREALATRVHDLKGQYDGLVTDQDLRAKVTVADQRLDECTQRLAELGANAEQDGQARFDAAPHTALTDWRRAQDQAEQRCTQAAISQGAAEERKTAAAAALRRAQNEPGGRTVLEPAWQAATLEAANQNIEEIVRLLTEADDQVNRSRLALSDATAAKTRLAAFASTVKDRLAGALTAAARSLAAAGKLGSPVSLEDLEWDTPTDLDLTNPVAARLAWMNDALQDAAQATDPLKIAPGIERFTATDLETFVTQAVADIDNVDRHYRTAEDQVHSYAEKLRQCSLNAPHKAAGTVVGRLKSAPLDELIANATSNDYDVRQRLAAVSADLQNFSTELDHSVTVVSTTVETIRARIRTIANRSKLPTDDRLGVWSGQEFLKIHWSESSRDSRRKLIREALEAMIDHDADWQPETTGRKKSSTRTPAPLERLVEAITPNIRAEVLIPKVPFDGRHHPMEELAMRTSGGEGVTISVIIAALMLSMRSPSRKEQTFLIIDNIFAKVVEPSLLRLMRQVARGLRVQLILLTPSRDPHALSVFSNWVQLKVHVAGQQTLVAPAAMAAADIPRQLRREPLVAAPTATTVRDTTSAKVAITDPSLGTGETGDTGTAEGQATPQ
ncbi:hypothetical protein GCM10010123_20450 [Pilimelia anulata]|uniref:Uncharacterized protein n=1 Tax=Pilimelia anulata TaxID=53371 RepID=A0A8J3F8Y7_9ACTN|nr:hypothetical protein [Pilimelia anulata]GGJ90526.1 hypothetical protein GCM10010123_20450 [Pilimelia anulata]